MQLPLALAPSLRLAVLGSGSSGNAVVVESGGERLMVDAGFSCKEILRRLAAVGLEPEGFRGLVLTHEHGDHVRGARVFSRRHQVPVFATAGTLEGSGLDRAGVAAGVLRSGEPQPIGAFTVSPFSVPHDAREPVGVVIEDAAGRRVGLIADLGTRSHLAWAHLADLDVLLLETNHDLTMLRDGPYPWHLKERIASRHGHLSNREAADGLPELLCDRLEWIVLYHLSRTNNRADLAAESVGEVLVREGSGARLCVTSQFEPSPWIEVGGPTPAPSRAAAPLSAVDST